MAINESMGSDSIYEWWWAMKILRLGLFVVLASVFILSTASGNNNKQTKTQFAADHANFNDCGDEEVLVTPVPKVFKLINQDAFKFATCLRAAINANNKQWIATHTLYPFNALVQNHLKVIRNKNDFVKHYDYIIDRAIKQMARDNKRWTVGKLADGYMIGDGQIWIASLGPPHNKPPTIKYYIVRIQ